VVREFAQMRATQPMPPVDDQLAEAIGPATTEELQQIQAALEVLAQRLIPGMRNRHRQSEEAA
jgi:hypothetical protein